MAEFGGIVQGLTHGINLGMGIDKHLRDREREPIEQQQRDEQFRMGQEQHRLNNTLNNLRIEEYADKKKRVEAQRRLAGGIAAIEKGDMNNPDLIESVNLVFKNEIEQGLDDEIVGKRINNFYSSPDGKGFMAELEITKKDGSKDYKPMTNRRSTDPNDRVTVFSGEEGMTRLLTAKQILDRMDAHAATVGDDVFKERLENKKLEKQHGYKLEEKKVEHGYKLKEIDATEKARANNYVRTAKAGSADMQWYGVLTKEINMEPREAVQWIKDFRKTAAVNPVESQRKIQQMLTTIQEKKMLLPGDPGYMSPDEIMATAAEHTQEMLQNYGSSTDLSRPFPVKPTGPAIGLKPKGNAPVGGIDPMAVGPVTGAPRSAMSAPAVGAQQPVASLPPQALSALQQAGGKAVRFANGQVWKLDSSGQPIRAQ